MISNIQLILSNSTEYFLTLVISILGICILFMFLFSKSPRRVLIRFLGAFLAILLSNIMLFFVSVIIVSKFLGFVSEDLGVTLLMFLVSLTIIFNMNLILKLKGLLPKAKKSGDLSEVSGDAFGEVKSRSIGILVAFIFVVIPILIAAFGDWEIFSVLIYVAVSIFICSLSSIILFPILFNKFNKIVK